MTDALTGEEARTVTDSDVITVSAGKGRLEGGSLSVHVQAPSAAAVDALRALAE